MPLIHDSWMRMKPNEINGSRESFDDYYPRILEKVDFSHIPEDVFRQWIHAHHDNHYTQQNYGWLNYETVTFEMVKWKTSVLEDLYVIESYRPYVNGRAQLNDLSKFMCTEEDLLTWKELGTWKTPPIIFDVGNLKVDAPAWAELGKSYQLVEGHSRYGYFLSLRHQKRETRKLAREHIIYLMRANK